MTTHVAVGPTHRPVGKPCRRFLSGAVTLGHSHAFGQRIGPGLSSVKWPQIVVPKRIGGRCSTGDELVMIVAIVVVVVVVVVRPPTVSASCRQRSGSHCCGSGCCCLVVMVVVVLAVVVVVMVGVVDVLVAGRGSSCC